MKLLTWQKAEQLLDKQIERSRAFKCSNPTCKCRSAYLKHCPGCGELYLYSGNDHDPCIYCEDHVTLDPEQFGCVIGVWSGHGYGVTTSHYRYIA